MNKSDVFLSYRRADKVFTQRLDQAIKAEGLEVWVDWEDIPPGSTDFTQDIKDGIEGADVFVAVLSPSYLESPFCMGELEMAMDLHKRIVPIVLEKFDVSKIPSAVGHINWVYFTPHVGDENKFEDAFPVLMEAINTDHDYVADHTRFLLRAKQWEEAGKKAGFLLSGVEIDEGEQWLALSGEKQPGPTQLHSEYIFASRANQRAQQRRLLTFVSVGFVISLALLVVSIYLFQDSQKKRVELDSAYNELQTLASDLEVQRDLAEREREESRSLLWATYSIEALDENNTLLAIPLAMQANRIDTPPALSQRALSSVAYAPGPRHIYPVGGQEKYGIWTAELNREQTAFATGTSSGMLSIWENDKVRDAEWEVQAHAGSIWDVEFIPGKNQAITSGADGKILVWDLDAKEQIGEFAGHEGSLWAIDIDRNGHILAGGGINGQIYVWDMETRELLHAFDSNDDHLWAAQFSRGSAYLATAGSNQSITLWDTETFEEVRTIGGLSSDVWAITYSADDEVIYTGHQDGAIRAWSIESGARIRTYEGHSDRVVTLEINPVNGQLLSASADSSIIEWQGNTVAQRYEGHEGIVWDLDYSDDGLFFLSASADGTVISWDTRGGAAADSFELENLSHVNTMAVHPNGLDFVVGSDDRVIVQQNLETGNINRFSTLHTDSVNDLAYSPDGSILLSAGDNRVIVWESSTGFAQARMTGHTDKVQSVAYHPTEPLAISGSSDNRIILWNLEDYSFVREFRAHNGSVLDVAFSPDGSFFASASADRDVILWDWESGDIIRTIDEHRNLVQALAFSPDGNYLATGGADNIIYLHDLNDSEAEPIRFTGHTDNVESLGFNPDGTMLISSSNDGSVIIWDMSGSAVRIFDGLDDIVVNAAFNPTQLDRAISVTANREVVIWRADTLEQLMDWTENNRGIRPLNCYQRDLYQLPATPECREDLAPPPGDDDQPADADANTDTDATEETTDNDA